MTAPASGARAVARILVLNGPNLNLLGVREPEVYGRTTLDDIARRLCELGRELGVEVELRQTNHEGVMVDWIQEARGSFDAILINPAAFTHTSVAVRDALAVFDGPVIEVHLSNIFAREPWRHHSWISPVADGVICGLGALGYELALRAAVARLRADPAETT